MAAVSRITPRRLERERARSPRRRPCAASRRRAAGRRARVACHATAVEAVGGLLGPRPRTRLALEQPPQAVAENLVVVGDRDAHGRSRDQRMHHPGLQRQLDARADAGARVDRQAAAPAIRARSLMMAGPTRRLSSSRADSRPSNSNPRPSSSMTSRARPIRAGQPHEHVARAAVLADVDERLLDDAHELERGGAAATTARRRRRRIARRHRCRGGSARRATRGRREADRCLELDRTQRLHQLAQREHLALQQLLDVAELSRPIAAASRAVRRRSTSIFISMPKSD